MAQGLVVVRDRLGFGCNAERSRDLQARVRLRQLPESAEQTSRCTPGEHDEATVLDPQRCTRQHRELVLLLAWPHDRELVLAARACSLAMTCEWAHEAVRRGRTADRGAELHEPLIELAGSELGWQRGHQIPGALP